jgi:hypothetical protein
MTRTRHPRLRRRLRHRRRHHRRRRPFPFLFVQLFLLLYEDSYHLRMFSRGNLWLDELLFGLWLTAFFEETRRLLFRGERL